MAKRITNAVKVLWTKIYITRFKQGFFVHRADDYKLDLLPLQREGLKKSAKRCEIELNCLLDLAEDLKASPVMKNWLSQAYKSGSKADSPNCCKGEFTREFIQENIAKWA